MDHYELGAALAVAHLAELHRQANRRRLASRISGRTAGRREDRPTGPPHVLGRHGQAADRAVAAGGPGRGTGEAAMLVGHQHEAGVFDAGHCPGLRVTSQASGETIIAEPVTDQAALHGLLAKVRDLGLELLSVRRTDPN